MKLMLIFFSPQIEENIPYKYSDPDAYLQDQYLQQGIISFQGLQREYHACLFDLLDMYVHNSMDIYSESLQKI